MLSKAGGFVGQHIFTPLQGVAVHINAFNFPVWGMLEKLGPTLLAGMPAIVKPATATNYLAEACVRILMNAGVLPAGALQLVVGGVGDLFDHLTCQDAVSFTGSAETAAKLQSHPVIARDSVRFIAERDSLNATVLGPDAQPGAPEFDLFVKEIAREMTVKAGQKCTAIRRAFAPRPVLDAVQAALTARLSKVVVGDPREDGVTMGALVSLAQRKDVRDKAARIAREAKLVFGDLEEVAGQGCGPRGGRLSLPAPPALRRSLGGPGGARCGGVRPGLDDHAVRGPRGRGEALQPRPRLSGHVAVHPRPRGRARDRAGRGRLSRPPADRRPRLRQGVRPATARRCRT